MHEQLLNIETRHLGPQGSGRIAEARRNGLIKFISGIRELGFYLSIPGADAPQVSTLGEVARETERVGLNLQFAQQGLYRMGAESRSFAGENVVHFSRFGDALEAPALMRRYDLEAVATRIVRPDFRHGFYNVSDTLKDVNQIGSTIWKELVKPETEARHSPDYFFRQILTKTASLSDTIEPVLRNIAAHGMETATGLSEVRVRPRSILLAHMANEAESLPVRGDRLLHLERALPYTGI